MRQDPILTEFRKTLFAIAAQQPGGHLARSLNRCFFRQQPRIGIFFVIVAQYPVYASGEKMISSRLATRCKQSLHCSVTTILLGRPANRLTPTLFLGVKQSFVRRQFSKTQ
jgi:hypothetical protein